MMVLGVSITIAFSRALVPKAGWQRFAPAASPIRVIFAPYSPECVEGKFSELRLDPILGSSLRIVLLVTLTVMLGRR
jgi:hypothetical protein